MINKRKEKNKEHIGEREKLSFFRLVATTRNFLKIVVLQSSALPRKPVWQSFIAVKLQANYDLTKRNFTINVFLLMFSEQLFTTEASQIWMHRQSCFNTYSFLFDSYLISYLFKYPLQQSESKTSHENKAL